jgi:hypothetical protein
MKNVSPTEMPQNYYKQFSLPCFMDKDKQGVGLFAQGKMRGFAAWFLVGKILAGLLP